MADYNELQCLYLPCDVSYSNSSLKKLTSVMTKRFIENHQIPKDFRAKKQNFAFQKKNSTARKTKNDFI